MASTIVPRDPSSLVHEPLGDNFGEAMRKHRPSLCPLHSEGVRYHVSNHFLRRRSVPRGAIVHIPGDVPEVHPVVHNLVFHVFQQDFDRALILDVQAQTHGHVVRLRLETVGNVVDTRDDRVRTRPTARLGEIQAGKFGLPVRTDRIVVEGVRQSHALCPAAERAADRVGTRLNHVFASFLQQLVDLLSIADRGRAGPVSVATSASEALERHSRGGRRSYPRHEAYRGK